MTDATREHAITRTETTQKPQHVTLPWGRADLIGEVTVASSGAGEQPVVVGIAHLREPDGTDLVRFFYRSSGRVVRGPLTLRPAERKALKRALARSPALRALLQELVS